MNTNNSQADILIVDDTPDNLRLLSTMLLEQSYEVRCVTNGSTALMGIHAQTPDLILLDINMPGMNGFELCRQLKADINTQEIPIIFISALNEVFDKVTAFSVGGADYIAKPFQVGEVIARIENQLKISRLQAQLKAQNSTLEQAKIDLHNALEQEKSLNQRIEEMAAIEERNRIARDIHDSLGHALVALNIQLETALSLWQKDSDKAFTFLKEAKQMGSESLKLVRQSVSNLRSNPLQEQLLESAIANLLQEFYQTTAIKPKYQINLSYPLSNQLNTAIYRIVQEGLTNILKHAAPTAVQLQIQATDSGIYIILQDNGKGFQINANRTGFGLRGMQERIKALNGKFNVDSKPGQGCRIKVFFPRNLP